MRPSICGTSGKFPCNSWEALIAVFYRVRNAHFKPAIRRVFYFWLILTRWIYYGDMKAAMKNGDKVPIGLLDRVFLRRDMKPIVG